MLFNVFEPKLVDSLLYAMIEFFNHGIQGTATWNQLSFVPHERVETNGLIEFDKSLADIYASHRDCELLIAGLFVCWSLTFLCHSNGHIETMPAREINPFTALTRIRSQFLRTQ